MSDIIPKMMLQMKDQQALATNTHDAEAAAQFKILSQEIDEN